MRIVYLRSLPFNNSKIYQQIYDDVKKKSNNYVYVQNDRIKKICSCKQENLQNIIKYGEQQQFPYNYDIYLIDPDQQKIKQIKLNMLNKQKEQFNQKIEQYSAQLIKIEKNINKLIK